MALDRFAEVASYEAFYSRFRLRVDWVGVMLCMLIPWTGITYNVVQLSMCHPEDTRIAVAPYLRADPLMQSFPCSDDVIPGAMWFLQPSEQVDWLMRRLPWFWIYTITRYFWYECLPGLMHMTMISFAPLVFGKAWWTGGRTAWIIVARSWITVWLSMEHFDWDMTAECGSIVPHRLHKFLVFNIVWRAVLYGVRWKWHFPLSLLECVLTVMMAARAAGLNGQEGVSHVVVQGAVSALIISTAFSCIEHYIMYPIYQVRKVEALAARGVADSAGAALAPKLAPPPDITSTLKALLHIFGLHNRIRRDQYVRAMHLSLMACVMLIMFLDLDNVVEILGL